MDDRSDWRKNLAGLLGAMRGIWNARARIALGAAAASVATLGAVPATAQAKTGPAAALSIAAGKNEAKAAKIGSMFVLKAANGSGKAFAEHGSHSSHSSHRSHRSHSSGAWVR